MRLALLLLAGLLLPAFAAQGNLTVIVRDVDGTAMRGITVRLYHDADDGAIVIAERPTDARGSVHFDGMAYGIYIVQFLGSAIQPVGDQNAGMQVDGRGVVPGFGVRLAQADLVQPFVLVGEPLVPMFDLSDGTAAVRPVVPELGKEVPIAQVQPPRGETAPWNIVLRVVAILILVLAAIAVTVGNRRRP